MSDLEDDLVAVTPDLLVEDLIIAYRNGIFPWPIDNEENMVPWFAPQDRGVLEFKDFHIPRSLEKLLKKKRFKVSFCQNFEEVIELCEKTPRKGQLGTWINEEIKKTYTELFKMKKAYSVEVWKQINTSDRQLVGGLYGVISDKYVSGESMFFLESGASKVALVSLVKRLENFGLSFLDTQMVTPLLESFGGVEVPKNRFMKMIEEGIVLDKDFFDKLSQGA